MDSTPDAYRSLIHFLKDEKAEYHTYQLQQDKPIRVVIRSLHPTTPVIRSVTNVLHKINKYPLPLFFIDLEPIPYSNDTFKLSSLLCTKIKVEEPFKTKTISQCINFQEYGHTRSYCGYPSRCVRCSAFHQSSACPNPPGTPPKCALCQGTHPASYKGCSVYEDLQRCKKPMSSNFPFDVKDKSRVLQDSHPPNRTPSHEFTYAQATSGQNSNQSSSSAAPDINNLIVNLKSKMYKFTLMAVDLSHNLNSTLNIKYQFITIDLWHGTNCPLIISTNLLFD
ncbi:Uncharacterized protein FWK35_00020542 [Aphis craccivora]|uniref:Pre-C2HC domain-containing protein n=1 Tax=Aphis craccivora TaxID=307492 RepID=A0A6G0Y1C4_APHCR|nr:Uncharacterized protein FWK35_00020542 [Aphis craccivora]